MFDLSFNQVCYFDFLLLQLNNSILAFLCAHGKTTLGWHFSFLTWDVTLSTWSRLFRRGPTNERIRSVFFCICLRLNTKIYWYILCMHEESPTQSPWLMSETDNRFVLLKALFQITEWIWLQKTKLCGRIATKYFYSTNNFKMLEQIPFWVTGAFF